MIKTLKQLSIKKPKDINIFMSKIKSSILDSNGKQFVVDKQELINVGEQSWPFADSITVSKSLTNDFCKYLPIKIYTLTTAIWLVVRLSPQHLTCMTPNREGRIKTPVMYSFLRLNLIHQNSTGPENHR